MAEEPSQDGLVKGVLYEADYILDVRGLDSGGSRDVHGQVRFLMLNAVMGNEFLSFQKWMFND